MQTTRLFPLLLLCLSYTAVSGQSSFHKIYGDSTGHRGNFLLAATDSTFLVAGAEIGFHFSHPTLTMVTSDGAVLWNKSYPTLYYGRFFLLTESTDGGYLAVGSLVPPPVPTALVLLVKIDANGNMQWSKNLSSWASVTAVESVADGFFLCGTYQNGGTSAFEGWVIKVDQTGELVWHHSYGHTNFHDLYGENDTLYTVGYYNQKPCFSALDPATGGVYFFTTFANPAGINHHMAQIRPTADGNFMTLGGLDFIEPDGQVTPRVSLQKISRTGSILWSRMLYVENDALNAGHLENTLDSGFIIRTGGRSLLVKTNADGVVQMAFQYVYNNPDFLANFLPTPDGGFLGAGYLPSVDGPGQMWLVKTLPDGSVEGCCTPSVAVKTSDFPVSAQNLNLDTAEFILTMKLPVIDENPKLLSVTSFCPYNAVVVRDTLAFCPGDSVLVGSSWYSMPGLTVFDTLFNPVSCDTIITYHLQWLPQPVKTQTLEFCPGDTVTLDGIAYTQPGTVSITVPAATGCDTIVTYTLEFTPLTQPSTVSIQCPGNILVVLQAGDTTAVIDYGTLTASTDCPCGPAVPSLIQGLPSGAIFPVGLSPVCYQATDDCGAIATCCFTVTIQQTTPAASPPPVSTSWRLYPNPVNSGEPLTVEVGPRSVDREILIRDMLGRLIKTVALPWDHQRQELGALTAGLYRVELEGNSILMVVY
jgi:hypothetical protein